MSVFWNLGRKMVNTAIETATAVNDFVSPPQPVDPALLKIPINLPQSLEDLSKMIKSKLKTPTPQEKNIIKYSATSLETGRPLNKVMIVIAGQNGTGKSTIINSLFNANVCSNDSNRREATEYSIPLCVTEESPPIKGFLSFVDVPEDFEVHPENYTVLTKFRGSHGDLARRVVRFKPVYDVKENVYPNLVLMFLSSDYNQQERNSPKLQHKFNVLDQLHLIDKAQNNIIVVVTHAMNFLQKQGRDNAVKRREQIKHNIQTTVERTLGICNVEVIFVENMQESYSMNQGAKSEFRKETDDHLSQYNLAEAIFDHFKQNHDYLGCLLCGWYMDDNCPEKNVKLPKVITVDSRAEPKRLKHSSLQSSKKRLNISKDAIDAALEVNDFSASRQPKKSEGMTTPIDLPGLLSHLYNIIKLKPKAPTPQETNIIKYSIRALEIGRPLNKVMIVIAGQKGTGKSTTINSLFNKNICSHDPKKQESTEYIIQLCVTEESPPVKGFLSFVDVSGSSDAEQSMESTNFATLTKFRETDGDLATRRVHFQPDCEIKENVYPNLVLLFVRAGYNQRERTGSHLVRNLKALDHFHLIDKAQNNLIVVVTHAMNLQRYGTDYKVKCTEQTEHIQTTVEFLLGICDVNVIFVENMPENYPEFYKMSESLIVHYGLAEAILDHFKQHHDYLGCLLYGWYLADNCPEKADKLQAIAHEDIKDGAAEAHRYPRISTENEDDICSFPFLYLGRGYCPVNESTKNVTVFSKTETQRANVLGKTYVIPKCVQLIHKNECHFNRFTYETLDMYKKSRLESYGLEYSVNLELNDDSAGRWVKGNRDTLSMVSILHEIRQARIRIAEVESNLNEQIALEIDQLPTEYNQENAYHFCDFFMKWGTHFICDVWVGGSIKVDCPVKPSTFTDEIGNEITREVQRAIGETEFNEEFIHDEKLIISGGDPPDVTSLKELVPKMESWIQSTMRKPVELQYSFKLFPYYNLISAKWETSLQQHSTRQALSQQMLSKVNKGSLRDATIAYLGGTMTQKLSPTRSEFTKRIITEIKEQEIYRYCFPPCATVCTKDGVVAFKDLRVTAKVLTTNNSLILETSSTCFTEMYAYIHYDSEMVANYLVFHLENGLSLTVTGDHLIFRYHKGKMRAFRAKQMKIGDSLICVTELRDDSMNVKSVRIVEISNTIIKGVCSPLTYDGRLIVDGILVSCYAYINSHTLAHTSIAPLRWWYTLKKAVGISFNYLNGSLQRCVTTHSTSLSYAPFEDKLSSEIHQYARFLMLMRNFLPFKLLQD